MDKQELLNRLTDIEWDDFEVKEARLELPKTVWETVSAFSNASGGWLILGVGQKGKNFEITGVENPEKLEQDFVTALRRWVRIQRLIRAFPIFGLICLKFHADHIPKLNRATLFD